MPGEAAGRFPYGLAERGFSSFSGSVWALVHNTSGFPRVLVSLVVAMIVEEEVVVVVMFEDVVVVLS